MPEILPRASNNDLEAAAMRAFGYSPDEELMPAVIADMVLRFQEASAADEVVTPYVGGQQPSPEASIPGLFVSSLWNKTLNILVPDPDDPPGKITIAIKLALLAGGLVAVGFLVREAARTYKAVA